MILLMPIESHLGQDHIMILAKMAYNAEYSVSCNFVYSMLMTMTDFHQV